MKLNVDIESLRAYLINFYGTAMHTGFGAAVIDLGEVENASAEKLIQIALDNGIDLRRFGEEVIEDER